MSAKLTFLGAAQNVTGSCYLLEANDAKILVDCGLFQEREYTSRNWEPFHCDPAEIDAVLLTHAHLDHCGLLPKLVKEGFEGPIYCTSATAEIADIVLQDAGKLQEEDAEFKKKRHRKEGRKGAHPEVPLYTQADAQQVKPLLKHVGFDNPIQVSKGIECVFREAGHILGAASVLFTVNGWFKERKILFSGDIGRPEMPILRDPKTFDEADYVLIESTYGNRTHKDDREPTIELAETINEAYNKNGIVLIPSFAVERSQDLLYYLHHLLLEKKIPRIGVFMDSPMAIKVTDVFMHHPHLFDEQTTQLLEDGLHPCDFPGLKMCRSVKQSKDINDWQGPAVVIAGSGMCTGGRIKHHLFKHISNPDCTILFVGYQAMGTLGRIISEGAKKVRIHGKMHRVEAQVKQIHGFSGHADRIELFDWISALKHKPRRVFATHGELKSATALAGMIEKRLAYETEVPAYKERVTLS